MLSIELEQLGVELKLKVTSTSAEPLVEFFHERKLLPASTPLLRLLQPTLVRYEAIPHAWVLYLEVYPEPLFLLPKSEQQEEYGYYWHHDGKLWVIERILLSSSPVGTVTLGLSLKHRIAKDKPYTRHHLSLLCEPSFVDQVKSELSPTIKAFLQ